MGFIGKMVTKAVVKKVENTAMHSVVSHMESTRSVDALVSKSNARYMLFIKKKSLSFKRGFTVCDESNNKKYIIKTEAITFGYPCIRLYDTKENEIGKVALTSKTGMGTYTMSLDGKTLGTLTRKMSVKIKFDLSFNGWHLDGNLMQNSFTVIDQNGNQIMTFNDAFSSREIR